MPPTDLFTPDFPHGTLSGYAEGCHGSACAHHADPAYLSCKEVAERVRTDYGLRNWGHLERMPRTTAKPAPPTVVKPPAPTIPAPTPVAQAETPPAEAIPGASAGGPKHGTTAMRSRGCKRDEDCPNFGIDGKITCAQASRDYNAAWYAEKKRKTALAAPPTQSPSIDEPTAATDLSDSSIEQEPAPAEESVPDPAPLAAAAVVDVEAGYPDVDDQPRPDLAAELLDVRAELADREKDLEAVIVQLELAEARANAAIATVDPAGTGGESPDGRIDLTVGEIHFSAPAGMPLEVRTIGTAISISVGR
ncbi:MAG: hypothetical protein ABIP33_06295 [Pseudolysinimonas sp.]